MCRLYCRGNLFRGALLGSAFFFLIAEAFAQPPSPAVSPPPAPPVDESGPDVVDSTVGYIDSALLGNQFRLRFDAAYDDTRPTRAEFFYPKGGATGPGLPSPETKVDYQELSNYLELHALPRLSVFIETPVRFIDPEINANHYGFGDLNAGFKYAFFEDRDTVATFQFRTYVPTGGAREGLGTDHVSLEPALLFFHRLAPCWTLEGEFRHWIPIGGTDFAGNIIRYGAGLSYGQRRADSWWLSPVVEIVGWTVLDGKELASIAPGTFAVESARGDTIVNAKAGFRLGLGDRAEFYTGYGYALTHDTWYRDIWRFEFRFFF
jgi:hypothetical protein